MHQWANLGISLTIMWILYIRQKVHHQISAPSFDALSANLGISLTIMRILYIRQKVHDSKHHWKFITCMKVASKPKSQIHGQLAVDWPNPGPIFDFVGIDYTGPSSSLNVVHGKMWIP